MRRWILLALAAATLAGAAQAQSPTYLVKHWSQAAGDETVTFQGRTFVNHGLVAVGRLDAATRDFKGDTLGSFSGMALRSWRRLADGTYEGQLLTLPDRGPNGVGSVAGTVDYANRLHAHRLTLAGGKLTITPTGGFLLKDQTGQPFTGKDPGPNVLTRDGVRYPSPATGEGAGKISLDSEAVAYLPDGAFYVSDEYAAGIYLFDRTGRQIGAIQAPPALLPMRKGQMDFTAESAPTTGRRNNQGLEALAVTPDGKRLVAILQSATMQDTAGSNAATRNNTRVLVYDISKSRTPKAPIGHYVLQLPVVRESGDGQAADVTAAQSEMLALNDHQFLVLARDANGRGKGSTKAPVFKAVLLVDTTGATNLAGGPYEQGVQPVAADGALAAGLRPVRQAELVNLLNPVQLARFGMNLSTAPSDRFSLSEKWEAMALAPALDPAAPNDVFLLVGNDNDFLTAKGQVNGQAFDAGLTNDKGAGEGDNDSVILVYRLTLPAGAPGAP
ncbi:esterase-like activity of phytase family protein [Caulobacter sp. UNC358MFTsu5.1]|uniref:esterase-like activity of phytase family protein n=1 Tax=Caulobacter sp. UNC358MFTsu5.1 TaxID=1449049 RepID=UPI00054F1299|nr:esterase-like activity of phytase family protein [Caulobacter sp. UNC358MFTsu5.1]